MKIKKVTVIGANGTLGIGVSSMFASFGDAKVYMIARSMEKATIAIGKAGLTVKANSIIENLIPCTYEDIEQCIQQSDLIIETIVEDFEKKKIIHQQINQYMKPEAICASVTSGISICASVTSGISIHQLASCYSIENAKRFVGMHFFNPPYNLQLLELIETSKTDSKMVQQIEEYLTRELHRKVIKVKDKPGFLANRIGFQWINQAMQYAEKYKNAGGIDYIDTILGCFTGRNMPPIRTADFVGLDVHKAIVDNLYENTKDEAHATFLLPKYVEQMIQGRKLGDKTGEGLYKVEESQVWDIATNQYRKIKNYKIPFIEKVIEKFKVADYEEGMHIIMKDSTIEAQIARKFLTDYIIYSIKTSKEVAEKVDDCDIAMAEGFNWIPPFALAEIIGTKTLKEILPKDILLVMSGIKSKYHYEKFLKAKR